MPFNQVIKKYGYPVVSKEVTAKIRKLRGNRLSERYRNYLLNGDKRGKFGMLPKKWQFLIDALFVGITQDESFMREHQYNMTGCNVYDSSNPKSQPLGFGQGKMLMGLIVIQENRERDVCFVLLGATWRVALTDVKGWPKYIHNYMNIVWIS